MKRRILFVLALAPTSSMACNALIGLDAPSSASSDGGNGGDARDGGDETVSPDDALNHDSTSQDSPPCAIAATFAAPQRMGASSGASFSAVALVRDGVYALASGTSPSGTPMQLFHGSSCDGSLTLAHDATLLSALTTDSTAVYVATATSIESYPIDTSKGTTAELVQTLIDPSGPFAFASNGDDIFYTTAVDGSLRTALTRHPLSSPMAGSGIFWTSTDNYSIGGMVADDNGVYLTNADGDLLSISRQTSQSHVLVPGVGLFASLQVAGSYVYWIASNALRRARIADGVAEDVVQTQVKAFAVIGDDVYFAWYGEVLHTTIGSTTSASLAGSSQEEVIGVAADATRVCWWSASTITVIAR